MKFSDLADSNKSLIHLNDEGDNPDDSIDDLDLLTTDSTNTTEFDFENTNILESDCKTCVIPTIIIALIGLIFVILGFYYICKERRRRRQTSNIINSNNNINQINVVYN